MNYKKLMLVAFVLLAILTIGAVSASDSGDELAADESGAGDLSISEAPGYDDEILGNTTSGDSEPVDDDGDENTSTGSGSIINNNPVVNGSSGIIPDSGLGDDIDGSDVNEGPDDGDVYYNISASDIIDLNDDGAVFLSLICPENETGIFIIQVTDYHRFPVAFVEHKIVKGDYNNEIIWTAKDLGIKVGFYSIALYHLHDGDEIGEETLIFNDETEVIDSTKFGIAGYADEGHEFNILLDNPWVFSLYCPDGHINKTVNVIVRCNGTEIVQTLTENIESEGFMEWYLNDLNMAREGRYVISVNVNNGEFEEEWTVYVGGPIVINDRASIDNNDGLVIVEIPSNITEGTIIVEIDGVEAFMKDLDEFEFVEDTDDYYYWFHPSYGPGPGDVNFKRFNIAGGVIQNAEVKLYDVTARLILDNGTRIFTANNNVLLRKTVYQAGNVSIEINDNDVYDFEAGSGAELAFIKVDDESEGNVVVLVDGMEVFNKNIIDLHIDDEGYYFITDSDLGIDSSGEYEITVSYFENDELVINATFVVNFFKNEDGDDPYQVEPNWEFDIADEDEPVVRIYCPDETQGYFVVKLANEDMEQFLSYAYQIQESDYDTVVNITVADLDVKETGWYLLNVYLVDDPDDNLDGHSIFDDLATLSAIDSTQFRIIEEKTQDLNVLTTGNVIAVYCPEGSEGNISISVRRGDEDEPFHTTVRPIADVDGENKLHWTLSELNMEEEGEYFLNVYNGDYVIERGMRLTVDIPIYFEDVAYLDSESALVTVMLPSEMDDANITLMMDGKSYNWSLDEFKHIDKGTDSPYWKYRGGSGWSDENYKEYKIDMNHLEGEFNEGEYLLIASLDVEGKDNLTRDGKVSFFARDVAGNENITIEIFGHKYYNLDNDWGWVVAINANEEPQGSFEIAVTDNEWAWTGTVNDLKGGDGEYYIPPNHFGDLGPGEYEITVSYFENDELVINATSVVNFYKDGGDDDELNIGIWDDEDERGTLYTDAEGDVLSIDVPIKYEGAIFSVYVDDEKIEVWEPEFNEDGWAFKFWELEDLGISEAGDYTIAVEYDDGENSEFLLNKTISVSEFNEDTFRAMILYADGSIKFYCPEDGEGTVTITSEVKVNPDDFETLVEESYNLSSEDQGNWKTWDLEDLGFEPDGRWYLFTVTVTNGAGDEVYRYRIGHCVGGEEEGEEDRLNRVEFQFIAPEDASPIFNKTSGADVACVYIPDREEFEGMVVTVDIYRNGTKIKTIKTSELESFYDSSYKAFGYVISMDLSDLKDKDKLDFDADEYEEGVVTVIVEDLGDKVIFHDDYDPKRLEFNVFMGNMTTGEFNNPDLMGSVYHGRFVIITISNSLGITDGLVTVRDGASIIFSRALADCVQEYDYGSAGIRYVIYLNDTDLEIPEGKDLVVSFMYGNVSSPWEYNRIRFGDYIYKNILPNEILEQFPFEVADDVLTDENDNAIVLFSDSNRQSILIDFGGGYFTVYVNDEPVRNLGEVSFNTWLNLANWEEEDWDYKDRYEPDKEGFIDDVHASWGTALELFRLTSWTQGTPELNLTLADLGITKSGTYNIRITHFPSTLGGPEDDPIAYGGNNDGEYINPVETELLNKSIVVDFGDVPVDDRTNTTIDIYEEDEYIVIELLTADGEAVEYKRITYTVNGAEYGYDTDEDGKIYISFEESMNVEATFAGDDDYAGSSNQSYFEKTYDIEDLYEVDLYEGVNIDNKYGTVVYYWFDSKVTGTVAILFNGSEIYNETIYGNEYVDVTVEDLALDEWDFGTYSIDFVYSGDENFDGFTESATVEVTYTFRITFSYENGYYVAWGGPAYFDYSFADDPLATIVYVINGKERRIPVRDLQGSDYLVIAAEDIELGENNVTFKYVSDNYPLKTLEYSFTSKAAVKVPSQIDFDETLYVTVELPEDANGMLYVYEVIYDNEYAYWDYSLKFLNSGKVENGIGNVSVSDLSFGGHYIYVNYTGDYGVYLPVDPGSETLGMYVKVTPKFTVPERVWVNGTYSVDFIVPEDSNGIVTVVIGDESRSFAVVNGSATFDLFNLDCIEYSHDDSPADWDLEIYYSYKDDEYGYASGYKYTTVVMVSPQNVLELSHRVDYTQVVVKGVETYHVSFDLPSSARGNLTIYLDDKYYGTESIDGFTTVDINVDNLTVGKHDVRFEYSGDGFFDSDTAYDSFNVSFIDFEIPKQVIVGENWGSASTALALMPDDAIGEVKLMVDGVEIETRSVEDGRAMFSLDNLTYGNHTVTLSYQGNYPSSSKTANVEAKYNLLIYDYIYGWDTPYVKLPAGTTGIVKAKINGKEYSANIDKNGTAKFDFSEIPAGEYEVTVTYAGDDNHLGCSETFNLSVSYSIIVDFDDDSEVYIDDLANCTYALILPSDATGSLVVYRWQVDEDYYDEAYVRIASKDIVNGKAQISLEEILSEVDDGSYHELKIKYEGNYDMGVRYSYVSVGAIDITGPKYSEDIVLGETVTYTVKVSGNRSGHFKVMAGKGYKTVLLDNIPIEEGVATMSFEASTLGRFNFKIVYVGDDFKYDTYQNILVGPLNVTLEDKVIDDDVFFTVQMPDDASGNMTLYLYSENYEGLLVLNSTYDGSIATVDASDIPVDGIWTLEYFVIQDEKYGAYSFASTSKFFAEGVYDNFKVVKSQEEIIPADANLTVSAQDISAGEVVIINIAVAQNATGKVVVNGMEAIIANGTAKFEIPDLAGGTYNFTVKYFGDKYFKADEKTVTVNVAKIQSNVSVSVGSAFTVGDDITITVTNSSIATVTIDNKTYVVKDGKVVVSAAELGSGSHMVVAAIAGDDYFLPNSANATFTVSKKQSSVSVSVGSAFTVGDDITIAVTNSSAASVTIDNKSYVVKDGKVVVSAAELGAGSHMVVAAIAEDNLFLASSAYATFTVSKIQSSVAVDVGSAFTVGDDITIAVTNSSAASVTIDNKSYVVKDGKVVVSAVELGAGSHIVAVAIAGDDYFLASSANATFTVSKKQSSVSIDVGSSYTVGDDFTIAITNSSAVTVEINGKAYDVADGKVVIDTTALTAGDYEVVVAIAEDNMFLASSDSASFTIKKVEAPAGEDPFNIDDTKPVESKTPTYSISLPSDATGTLTVTVGDKTYSAEVINGTATVSVTDMPAGSYDVVVSYSGDSKYSPIVKTSKATVTVDPVVTMKATTVLYTGTYSVTVYGKDGKVADGQEVIFYINNKKVKVVKTNANGVATFTMPSSYLPTKEYTIKATALGKSASKKVTVKHLVTLKTVTIKKSAKKIVLQATLAKVNGKYLKNKRITFKFNGKKYTNIKTNSKGVAKLTIKNAKSGKNTYNFDKLKKGKKITYMATYLKDTVKKSAKVKI